MNILMMMWYEQIQQNRSHVNIYKKSNNNKGEWEGEYKKKFRLWKNKNVKAAKKNYTQVVVCVGEERRKKEKKSHYSWMYQKEEWRNKKLIFLECK